MIKKKRALFISSSGGHLTQLLQLEALFSLYETLLITEKNDVTKEMKSKYKIKYVIYSSRNQKLLMPFTFLLLCMKSLLIFIFHRPSIVITTGAGTAIPLCYIAKLFRKKVVYIETFSRITSQSLSGKLAYKIADLFIVQWEEMLKFYPKALYFGSIY